MRSESRSNERAQEIQVAPKQDESDGEKNQGLPARISQPVEPGSWRAALRSANDRRQQEDERHIAAEDIQFLKDGYALEGVFLVFAVS
jgi:hypothetical protein